MSGGGTAETAGRIGSGFSRAVRAWRVMGPERRLAAYAAIGMVLTLFLPWYQETLFADGSKKLESANASITGWGAFSFVEAAMLLIAAGVLTLLFQRTEGRAFHLPGGDGGVITAAGLWTCVLIVWRIFDKQGGTVHDQIGTTYGIEWGIFVALAVAALLAYSGSRIRAAHEVEPPLPGERDIPPQHDAPRPRDARRPRDAPSPRAGRSASGAPASRTGRPARQLGSAATGRSAQEPARAAAQRPAQAPPRAPAQRPAQAPARAPAQRPAQAPARAPAQRPAREPGSADPSAFPVPPAWSGGDVPTFDTNRLGADPGEDNGPPTTPPPTAETVTRVRVPDPHDQPTVRMKRGTRDKNA